jgi:hypothetical protein
MWTVEVLGMADTFGAALGTYTIMRTKLDKHNLTPLSDDSFQAT